MKKQSKSKTSGPKVDPYLEGLMGKLLERLVSLEKKMDSLVDQSRASQGPEAKQPAHRDRVLYEAICADCSKVCEVPFKPSEARPVYCKECFAKRKSGGAPRKESPFPVLTPVAMPSRPASKPQLVQAVVPALKKAAKTSSVKKSKKKK